MPDSRIWPHSQALLSNTFLQTLPELVTPLKGHWSLSLCSSKHCQSWLRHWRGTDPYLCTAVHWRGTDPYLCTAVHWRGTDPYLCTAVHWRCQCPLKGLGTTRLEATQHWSTDVNMKHTCPGYKMSSVSIQMICDVESGVGSCKRNSCISCLLQTDYYLSSNKCQLSFQRSMANKLRQWLEEGHWKPVPGV